MTIDFQLIGLDEEVKAECKKISRRIPKALNVVGSEMIENLTQHLNEDFYAKYQPKVYERKYDKGLRNKENMVATVSGKKLQFEYIPHKDFGASAEQKSKQSDFIKFWQSQGVEVIVKGADERIGDELLVWCQTQHKITDSDIPARPFWNNFVEEQKNSGIMEAFTRGMQPYNVIREYGSNDLDFDTNESLLDFD